MSVSHEACGLFVVLNSNRAGGGVQDQHLHTCVKSDFIKLVLIRNRYLCRYLTFFKDSQPKYLVKVLDKLKEGIINKEP